jgi:hypothetical protein
MIVAESINTEITKAARVLLVTEFLFCLHFLTVYLTIILDGYLAMRIQNSYNSMLSSSSRNIGPVKKGTIYRITMPISISTVEKTSGK